MRKKYKNKFTYKSQNFFRAAKHNSSTVLLIWGMKTIVLKRLLYSTQLPIHEHFYLIICHKYFAHCKHLYAKSDFKTLLIKFLTPCIVH